MAGLGIRLYTDEDVPADLAPELRRRGHDAITCTEARNAAQRLDDEWQLRFATRQHRAILVHNIADFMAEAIKWKARGEMHCGIIYVGQIPIGDLVQRTMRHLDTGTPNQQHDLILPLHP